MKLKIGDVVVMVFCIISTAIIFTSVTMNRTKADEMWVEVVIEREVVDTFPLNQNIQKNYTTELGTNTLIIEDGMVYIKEADCRDQICVDSKHGHFVGDAIVCLPNRFSVEIYGDPNQNGGGEVDAISE